MRTKLAKTCNAVLVDAGRAFAICLALLSISLCIAVAIEATSNPRPASTEHQPVK